MHSSGLCKLQSWQILHLIFTRIEIELVERYTPVTRVHSGRPGQPRKVIDEDWLRQALQPANCLSKTKIAKLCGVDRKTVQKAIKDYKIDTGFTQMTTDDLDELVELYRAWKPDSGYRYILGWLQSNNIKVPQVRVLESLRRVDELGQVLRNHAAIDRDQYSVPHSNFLWHMDGHHKIIRWGIVTHGIADGNCRSVSSR